MNYRTALVLIGITGDLAQRKILPAISELKNRKILPDDFVVIGTTRKENLSVADILSDNTSNLKDNLYLISNSLDTNDAFKKLDDDIDKILGKSKKATKRYFYLSVPPLVAENLVKNLGQSQTQELGNTYLLLEKPFGIDLNSANQFIKVLKKYFPSDRLLFVDHYLAKEVAQDIINLRSLNPLFKNSWTNKFISKVEIIAEEKIDIENRVNFYEQTGALRDFIQSHLLQLAGLLALEIPKNIKDSFSLKKNKSKVIKNFKITNLKNIKRGQYIGYRQEVGNDSSLTETFALLEITADQGPLEGVPITLASGKAFAKKQTIINIYFGNKNQEFNLLTLHLGPEEKANLSINRYSDEKIIKEELNLNWSNNRKDAYEHIILSIINSKNDLFATEQDILNGWKLVSPVQTKWQNKSDDLFFYQKNSEIESWL